VASNSLHPPASGPAVMRRISSSDRPAARPITTCWAHSYSDWQFQPVRRTSSSRSRAGIFPLSSFPPKGSHLRVTPSARISVVKMFASDPPTITVSSRAWAVGVLSAVGSGVIRGDVGRVAMTDDIPTGLVLAGTRPDVGVGVACHQMAYEDV